MEHGDEIYNNLEYRHIRGKLETRGINISIILFEAINLLLGYGDYKEKLELAAHSISHKANLSIKIKTVPSIHVNVAVADVKWLLNFYYNYFKDYGYDKWVQPVGFSFEANMLIIEGCHEPF